MNRVIVTSAARMPLGTFCGQLEGIPEQELAAAAMLEAVRRAGIAPEKIDGVIVGIGKQTSKPSNGGRYAMLLARLPESIPAYTVQRQSASGLQALANGYWAIRCGDAGVVLAGGTESMSRIPFEIRNVRYDFKAKMREIIDAIPAQEMGAQPAGLYGMLTTARVAANFVGKYGFSDGELADYAAESLRRAQSAGGGDLFPEEVVPVTVKKGKEEKLICRDELQAEPALVAPPADGAAMCLLAGREQAETLGLPILAEIASVGIAAADPRYAGLAAVEAGLKALGRVGMTLPEVDLIELNEMSAAESLAILREWESMGIDREALTERVNPAGGTLATGNPWGASGAILLTKVVYGLRRRGGRIGMAVLTAEGGQGMAMVLKRV